MVVSRTYVIGVVATGLLLAACGGGSEGASSATTSSTPTTAPTSATATPTATASASASPSTTTKTAAATPSTSKPAASASPAEPLPVVLEPDGLGYVVGGSSVRHLEFGTDAARARALLAGALGGPLTRTELSECGQGARIQYGRKGFSILVDGTKFVGWTDQGASGRRFATMTGIGVGSSLTQIKKELPGVTTTDGSLGAEFYDESGFGGILDETGKKAALVYAGETCFFR